MQHSNFDFVYAALGVIIGIVMMSSPRTFMRGAKYDEESMKTESLLKKLAIGLIVLSIGYGIYIFLR